MSTTPDTDHAGGKAPASPEQPPRTDEQPQFSEHKRRRPGLVQIGIGVALLAPFVLMAVAAPLLAPMDPNQVNMINRLVPPIWAEGGTAAHLLGTDHLGRDLLSRVIFGARVSMLVGVVAVVGSGTIGVSLGLMAGYYRKAVDSVVMGFGEIQQSFPFLALAITVVAVIGQGLGKLMLVLMLGGWILYARVVRGEAMALAQRDFVDAARALGASDLRIMFRCILPNITASIMIVSTFNFAWFIIAEASLSFLGLGVDPSMPSWGQMLSDSRNYLATAWWYPTFPGLALVGCVLGANLLGDGLQDYMDPWKS